MCKLNVWLAYGETRAILGLAGAVRITFAPGVVQTLDFWVVPLAMDVILRTPWLQNTQPAIDWSLSRVLWQHKGYYQLLYMVGVACPRPPYLPYVQWSQPSIFSVMQKMACTRMLHLLVCCNQPQQPTLWVPLVGLSAWTLPALRGTKLLLQNYLQSLVMCLMPQVNPHVHVSSIVLIWLMRPNSPPSFNAIICPSLSWMNLRNKLIACLPRDGSNHPLHLMAILFFLHAKKMAACAFVLISAPSMLTHVWIDTPSHALISC